MPNGLRKANKGIIAVRSIVETITLVSYRPNPPYVTFSVILFRSRVRI
jgi:hypothetical protein